MFTKYEISVEKEKDDNTFWVYCDSVCVGYLVDIQDGTSLYFSNIFLIEDQIKILTSLKLLKNNYYDLI